MVAKMGGFVTNCSGELQGGTVEGNCSKEQPDNVTKPNLTFIVDDGDDRIGLDESGTLWVPYRNVAKFAHAICVDLLGESNPRRSKRDHRLAIVCGVLRVSGRITAAPLQFAVESTKEARANNPFAYFRKVLASVLEANGVDLNRELQTTEIPESMLSIPPPSKLDATSKIGPVICDSS
jgi:hypothetical protein